MSKVKVEFECPYCKTGAAVEIDVTTKEGRATSKPSLSRISTKLDVGVLERLPDGIGFFTASRPMLFEEDGGEEKTVDKDIVMKDEEDFSYTVKSMTIFSRRSPQRGPLSNPEYDLIVTLDSDTDLREAVQEGRNFNVTVYSPKESCSQRRRIDYYEGCKVKSTDMRARTVYLKVLRHNEGVADEV